VSDLSELQKKVIDFRDARDWKQFHNPKDTAISLVLEAAELMEHFQWKSEDEIKKHVKNKHTEVSEELMDILYWVLLIANDLDIDIKKEFDRKMVRNDKKYPVAKAKGSHKKYTEL
jgi:NTP pyrophosphatase (non-canonical NTP hydrolase)